MFHILDSIHSLDPATAEFLWTTSVSTLLVLAGAIALWMLPWSDEEIEEVDQSFRKLVGQISVPQAQARTPLVQLPR